MRRLLFAGAVLSIGSLVFGSIWLREGLQARKQDQETLRRYEETHPPQKGGCPNESSVVSMILAAATIGSGVRCMEGEAAIVVGILGLGVALALLAGERLGQRWPIWLGIVHAGVMGVLTIPAFAIFWHTDAKVGCILWFTLSWVSLGMSARSREPTIQEI